MSNICRKETLFWPTLAPVADKLHEVNLRLLLSLHIIQGKIETHISTPPHTQEAESLQCLDTCLQMIAHKNMEAAESTLHIPTRTYSPNSRPDLHQQQNRCNSLCCICAVFVWLKKLKSDVFKGLVAISCLKQDDNKYIRMLSTRKEWGRLLYFLWKWNRWICKSWQYPCVKPPSPEI